jgi:hypothetical protein
MKLIGPCSSLPGSHAEFRLSNSMFQPIFEEYAVRQTGQIVMQVGSARTFLLPTLDCPLTLDTVPCLNVHKRSSRYFPTRFITARPVHYVEPGFIEREDTRSR